MSTSAGTDLHDGTFHAVPYDTAAGADPYTAGRRHRSAQPYTILLGAELRPFREAHIMPCTRRALRAKAPPPHTAVYDI